MNKQVMAKIKYLKTIYVHIHICIYLKMARRIKRKDVYKMNTNIND